MALEHIINTTRKHLDITLGAAMLGLAYLGVPHVAAILGGAYLLAKGPVDRNERHCLSKDPKQLQEFRNKVYKTIEEYRIDLAEKLYQFGLRKDETGPFSHQVFRTGDVDTALLNLYTQKA